MMNHFYGSIGGWHNLLPQLYARVVNEFPSGSHFVEVGCWKGSSSAAMCVEIINSGKAIKFDCVDTWKGSIEHINDPAIVNDTLYDEFIRNLKPVEGVYNAIRMSSVEAAKLYNDNSLDFVCIDASHDYDNVKADIEAWLPKIKIGGILAGDDYGHVQKAVLDCLGSVEEDYSNWIYRKVK